MKKLSLLFVFVLAFVMLFAFNVFAEDTNIAKDATVTIDGQFWPIDGANGTKDCRNYIIDGDATTGLPSSWNTTSLNYYLTFENERTISKVVILCNGSGVSGNNPGDVTDMNCSNDFTVTLKDASGKALYTKTFNAKDQTTLTYELPQVYSAKSVVVTSKYGGYATNQSFLREVEIYEHIAAEKVTASREITDEATLYTDGGGNAEATRDNNVNTAGSCGSAQWVNFHYLYSDPRTISKVVVVVNSTGDVLDANGNVVKTHTELSKLPNIYCRLYDKDGNKLDSWENKPTSDATPVTDENGTYAVYTFDLDGKVYDGVAKVEIATVHSNDKGLGIWEVEIYNQYYVCAEGQHNWKDATCLAPKTCVDCGTQEGELAAHTPAEDDGDCSTAVRCSLCKIVLVEAKKHVTNADGACTNEGCTRVGEINVADKATMVEPGPSTWGHVKPQYLYDKDYSTSTHAPKSTGFSYTFIYDDARLISKIVIVANGASNQPSASTSTANHAIYEVLVTLYDDKGAAVYTSEAYAFENENTVIEIVLPATYYAYSVKCTFASTEAWGNSLVREIEIYDTTVEKEEEVEEIPAPQEGCFERVDFKEYIEKTYYYTENNDYYYVVDEDGNYILDEKGNAIKYAGAPIGGNGGANPPGCELDGSSGSGYCMTWEQQYNSIQYNFKDKLLFAEITIGYKTSGNAADGYKLYIGDIVDGEEVWTLVVDFIVPEEAEWKEYLLNTFTLGEEGEGVEGTMFRFEWIPGVAVRNDPSLCEVKMLTFKNTCTWTENKVLDEGNCGYDRVAECTCSVCGVEKTVVTPASGEHDLSVVANATSATCVDFGLNAVKYCATCEKTFGGDRIEKYTGVHTYGTADCNKNTCLVCGYVDSKITVSPHTYGWNIGTNEKGEQMHGCSVCLTEAVRDKDEAGNELNTSSNLGIKILYATSVSDFAKTGYDVIRLTNDVASNADTSVKNNAIIDFGGYTYTKTGGRFQLQTIKGIVNGTIKQNHGLNALQVYCVGFIEDFNIIVGATYNDNATGIYMSYNASYGGSYINSIKNLTIDSVRNENGEYINSTTGLFNHGLEFSNTNSVIGTLDNVKVYSRGQAMTLKAKSIGTMTNCVFDGANVALALTELQCGIDLVNCQINSDVLAVYIEKVTTTAGNPIFFQFDADTTISSSGTAFYIIPTSDDYDFDDLTSAVALVDGKLYTSFETALAALKASTAETTTFTLIGDLELDAPIEISKAVQFSLGGGKFKVPVIGTKNFNEYDAPGYVLTASADGAFAVKEGGSLTITGDKGTLVGNENAIVVEEGGSALIIAGTYDGFNPQNYMASDSCYDIKDGKYTITKNHTFDNQLLYGVLYRADGDCNNCGYVRGVARVGDEYFATIEEAIAAAVAYNAVNEEKVSVELATNVDLEKSVVVSDVVKIVLNGKTISASKDTAGDGVFHVVAGGELTIADHTQYFTGTVNGVCASEYDMAIWADGGRVIIEAGIFTNVGAGDDDQYDLIYAKNGGIVEIKGGTFLAQTPKWTLNVKDNDGSTIVVTGGKFYNYNPAKSDSENPAADFTNGKCVIKGSDDYYSIVGDHKYFYNCDKVCEVCFEVSRPEATHTLVHVDAKAATCTATGNVEYWYCSDCGAAWLDQACTMVTNSKSVITPMVEHEYFTPCDKICMVCNQLTREDADHTIAHVAAKDSTCTAMGNIEYWYCEVCGAAWLDEALTLNTNLRAVRLPMAEHEYFYPCDARCMVCGEITKEVTHTIVHVEANAATCTATGNVEYWYCSDCGYAWADEALTQQTNQKNVITPMADHEYFYPCDARCMVCGEITKEVTHTIVHVDAKAATCTATGNTEYWYCSDCGYAWADEALTQQTNQKNVIIPMAEHEYFTPCDKICMVCNQLTREDANHEIVHVAAKAPTCTAMGNIEYWYCEVCGMAWLDEALTRNTNLMAVKLPMADHTNTEIIPAVLPAPSNNHTGKTEGLYCLDCETVVKEQVEFTAKDVNGSKDFLFVGASLTLKENISVNYSANIPSTYTDAYVVFKFIGDKEYFVDESVMKYGYPTFKFLGGFPQLMQENIEAYIYAVNAEGEYVVNYHLNYSIMKYCIGELTKSNATAVSKTAISDLLVMGAKTQLYMGYRTDSLVTDVVTAQGCTLTPSTFTSVDASENKQSLTGTADANTDWAGAMLRLGATTKMVLVFKSADIENTTIKVTVDGKTTEYGYEDFVYGDYGPELVIDTITVLQFGDEVKAEIYQNGEQVGRELTYSINTYLYQNYNKGTQQAKELIRALYLYGKSIDKYLG